MPAYNSMEYVLPENIKGEKGLIELLRNVRRDLSKINFFFSDKSLRGTLKIVKEGKYIYGSNKVDLSSAQEFVLEYKRISEGGCQHCDELRMVWASPKLDEKGVYCGKSEKESDVDEKKGYSLITQEYYSKGGCINKTPQFRPINEVLEDIE